MADDEIDCLGLCQHDLQSGYCLGCGRRLWPVAASAQGPLQPAAAQENQDSGGAGVQAVPAASKNR